MCVKTSSVTSVRKSTKQTYIAPTKDEQVLDEESDIIIIIFLVIIIAIKAIATHNMDSHANLKITCT